MCFKKPKAPQPTQQEVQDEAELKALEEAQAAELAREKAIVKRRQTELDVSKARARYGFRSLISGSKGGAGFIPNSNFASQRPTIGGPKLLLGNSNRNR